MLTHVVLFRFESLALAEEGRRRLLAMEGRIPTLRSIQCGVDTIRSARSQELALITTHDDHAALEAYAVHPVHQDVVAWMKANCGGTVAVDFVETSDDA